MDEIKHDGSYESDYQPAQTEILQNGGYPMHTFDDVKEIFSSIRT